MARSHSLRDDSGFALMEAIVSAAVLAVVALAVLSGIDGATGSTGRERARSVASSLAEQDQERLRSLQFTTLADYTAAAQTFNVDGITYTVDSTTRWVKDDTGGVPNCTSQTSQSDYVYVRTTVTSNVVGSRTLPVVLESIVAPPVSYSSTTGTLGVQVNGRAGTGVANLTVSIVGTTTGTTSDTAQTNSAGCALFPGIPRGNYTVSVTRPGWVGRRGNATPTASKTVTAGMLNLVALDYDQSAMATLTIKTYLPGSATVANSSAIDVSTINSSEPMRAFPQPAQTVATATITAANLFPFANAYNFWTGSCASQNPESYAANAGYFAAGHSVQTNPGGSTSAFIYQPPLNFRISKDNNNTTPNTVGADTLVVKATYVPTTADAGCADTYLLYPVLRTDAALGANPATAWLSQSTSTYDPGLPFGQYTFCVYDQTKNKTYKNPTKYDNLSLSSASAPTDIVNNKSLYSLTGNQC